ncbi:hypothetical protein DZA28_16465 [Pseudomonas alloputida]|uniref:Uncharacterized protein n=2 Tax=Pseudomonas TaxID=286 RepID=A0ABD6N0G6_9PSED|nr:hypothetical protein KKK_13670 [Pseudomonas putida B6-2]NWL47252.1 hypothetical protein [Pseudomonas hunanensis]PTV60213.1 hypothetical protein DBL03_13380 [Pseudomonas putida]TRO29287.1 hypothetical protein EQ845_29695 [Pseudomonas putida]TRZ61449.1 hypothetical protein DZA28_16465 [Pseudomonas alloputida]
MTLPPNVYAQHASGAFNRPDPEALLAVLGDDCIHLDSRGLIVSDEAFFDRAVLLPLTEQRAC